MPTGNREVKAKSWTTTAILTLVEPLIRRLIRRALVGGLGGDSIDHDLLLNFVADKHIDWTSATQDFSTTGEISSADIFVLDLNGIVVGHNAKIDFGATPEFQVLGTGTPDASMGFARFEDNASGPDVRFLKSRGGNIGDNVIVQDGDKLGRFRFQGADGGDFNTTAAEIIGEVDGIPGLNDIPGRVVFRTRISGGSLTDKMILDNTGILDLVSTTGALIVPRMTTTQRDALTAVDGMIIYNTTTTAFNFREAGAWVTK